METLDQLTTEEFIKLNLCIFMKLAFLVNTMNKLTMQVTNDFGAASNLLWRG
jgi:hypothetical protein